MAAILAIITIVVLAGAQLPAAWRGTASLFGSTTTIDATLQARDGEIVVAPDLPLGSLATVTVLSASAFDIQAADAARIPRRIGVDCDGRDQADRTKEDFYAARRL